MKNSKRQGSRLVVLAAVGIAGIAAVCTPRSAQAFGFAMDRYEPSPAGDVFFGSDFPLYNRYRVFTAAVVLDYARSPLTLRTVNGAGVVNNVDIIGHMMNMHGQLGVNIADRLQFNLSVPLSIFQAGPPRGQVVPTLGAYSSPVAGDVRLGARVRLVGDSDASVASLHLGFQAFFGVLPYNGQDHNVTDETMRFRPYLTLAGHPGPLRYSFSAGYHVRELCATRTNGCSTTVRPAGTSNAVTLGIGGEVFMQGALGFVADSNRLTVGPEGWVSIAPTLLSGGPGQGVSGEVSLGVNYLVGNMFLVGASVGPGFGAPGTPTLRGLFRVAYAPVSTPAPPPPPPDRDHDGVLDADDQCPEEPLNTPRPDPTRRGCPVHDTDHDGLLDDEDQCVNEAAGAHPNPERAGCPDGDEDHDGVLDHADQCRTEAQGEHPNPERAGCPDGDEDHDGVLDHADQCRDVPAGAHADPARAGCPLPDRDHDTVPDATDHCPDQPGAPHPEPERNGCPSQVRVENGMLRILSPVFFATNRDTILPRSFPVLQAVADALRASPELRRIRVEGHTDDVGDDARNMDLSGRRAVAVLRWLTEHQVEAGRLESQGFGETVPLVPIVGLRGRALNDARAQNRRVDFRIIDPAQGANRPAALGPAPAPAPAPAAPAAAPAAPAAAPAAPAPAAPTPAANALQNAP